MARSVTLSKYEFDSLFYPSIANGSAENETELEVAMRVIHKLMDGTAEEFITEERRVEARKHGIRLVPQRELIEKEVVYIFEEDEHRLIVDRLVKSIPRYTIAVAPQLHNLIKRLQETPKNDA